MDDTKGKKFYCEAFCLLRIHWSMFVHIDATAHALKQETFGILKLEFFRSFLKSVTNVRSAYLHYKLYVGSTIVEQTQMFLSSPLPQ